MFSSPKKEGISIALGRHRESRKERRHCGDGSSIQEFRPQSWNRCKARAQRRQTEKSVFCSDGGMKYLGDLVERGVLRPSLTSLKPAVLTKKSPERRGDFGRRGIKYPPSKIFYSQCKHGAKQLLMCKYRDNYNTDLYLSLHSEEQIYILLWRTSSLNAFLHCLLYKKTNTFANSWPDPHFNLHLQGLQINQYNNMKNMHCMAKLVSFYRE